MKSTNSTQLARASHKKISGYMLEAEEKGEKEK